jgi:hypothetical protein
MIIDLLLPAICGRTLSDPSSFRESFVP